MKPSIEKRTLDLKSFYRLFKLENWREVIIYVKMLCSQYALSPITNFKSKNGAKGSQTCLHLPFLSKFNLMKGTLNSWKSNKIICREVFKP